MPDLPTTFVVPARSEILRRWLRDYKLRMPGVDVGAKSRAFIDGSVAADMAVPIYADAVAAGNNADLTQKTSAGLETEARNLGLPERLPAGGGTGFVTCSASVGGGFIAAHTEIKDDKTGYRYECQVADVYTDGQPVPIVGIDTGPATNLPAGSVLRWTTQPVGIGATATVLADSKGSGLIGGRDKETDPQIILRIQDARANPAASGNNAAVRRFISEGAAALGIPLEESFVFSATQGPGSAAFVFTLRPASPGGSRSPSNVQIAAILAHLVGELPNDDGYFASTIVSSPTTIQLQVQWAKGARGWTDANPWPPSGAFVSAVTDALHFDVTTGTAPQIGKTFAFYDTAHGTFVRKRVKSFTGAGPYSIVCDTTNNASDAVYIPAVNELLCPWSDSLVTLVVPLLTQLGTLGPSEMYASFFDAGYRQRRDPISPEEWPGVLRNKDLELALGGVKQIADVVVTSPVLPYATPVGTPNVSANLIAINKILAFPLP